MEALATRTRRPSSPWPHRTSRTGEPHWGAGQHGVHRHSVDGVGHDRHPELRLINVSSALSKLGTGSKSLASHLTFIGKLQDTVDTGIGNLVDADLAKESAKLQSLQTQQQLGIQALSIANQSSSTLITLFR